MKKKRKEKRRGENRNRTIEKLLKKAYDNCLPTDRTVGDFTGNIFPLNLSPFLRRVYKRLANQANRQVHSNALSGVGLSGAGEIEGD